MSSRLNVIDLNSDAVPIEQNDTDKLESESVHLGIVETQTLTDQLIGNNEDRDMMELDISDLINVSDSKLGHLGGNDGGSALADLKLEEKTIVNKVEFRVNDLVWAKVRSHPWWPGQIFNLDDASEKARRHLNRDSRFLIGYFGDKSFAWNEESCVKPFHMNFSQMEKQTDLSSFQYAVDCSLDEVSRRVQFGLSCICLPEELSNKIRTQIVDNGGIKEEARRIEGKEDNLSNVDSFAPLKLIEYMRKLAEFPHEGIDRLDFVVAHSQLLAFNSWKGCYELPKFKTFQAWSDKDEDVQDSSSKKRKEMIDSDDVPMLKKEKIVDQTDLSLRSTRLGEITINKPEERKIISASEMLSQLRLIAKDPTKKVENVKSLLDYFTNFRNSWMKRSYNRIIKTMDDYEDETVLFKPSTPTNPEVQSEQPQNNPTALLLKFTDLKSVPPVPNLNEYFGKFGPLDESETEVLKKTKQAKVIFKRRGDAETAFSSSGKFKTFGPALLSYKITPQKNLPTKKSKKVKP